MIKSMNERSLQDHWQQPDRSSRKKVLPYYSMGLLGLLLAASQPVLAQIPEDALRMGWIMPSGTARNQAIGGAAGSLGGDLTSLFVNPAGLGVYKTGEAVMTPQIGLFNGTGKFRGTDTDADQLSKFSMGTTGFVLGFGNRYNPGRTTAFGLGINRMANFNNVVKYKGLNDYSSFSENMANEFFDYYVGQKNQNPGMDDLDIIDDALDDPNISLMTKMGLYTYLVDVDPGSSTVFSRAEEAGVVMQENTIRTSGGITEVALGFASNSNDKFYIGGSLGIPVVNYKRTSEYVESDANGAGNNEFNYSSYTENYTSKGFGLNLKLGVIFKPVSSLRIGLGLHTPTIYSLKDKLTSTMTTDIDTATGNIKVFSVNSSVFYGNSDPSFKYDLSSPWRFLVSGAWVFGGVQDVSKQQGFLTADLEYVTYGSARLRSGEDYSNDEQYFDDVNTALKASYKGALNFRVGGEMKFNTIMGRLGFAYYGNPYEDAALKASRMNLSGGIGYRNKGLFLDLTYVHSIYKDVHFPYRVDAPRMNTFAELRQNSGTVLVTMGVKI
ncbi:MAG: aromatic hydrocarbon degradation protein [Candidatus Pseudobacter hemicellulosilyticus]|uniref:Aromatic hydrocarbon degradation protein n=1 Tax=Candidatus Pseudobacter hemicellulosilyticus TaxID=3121375 RepID=A0AAJ6BF80_9BACT|nr:MAG: aromatic hydrocarbon degradation protein [Pseudobacter sp.]